MSYSAKRKQVLGIIGSPRRGSNTEILMDELLLGAQQAGAHIEKASLNKINIKPCRACEACKKVGTCVQKDDLQWLVKKMHLKAVSVLGCYKNKLFITTQKQLNIIRKPVKLIHLITEQETLVSNLE